MGGTSENLKKWSSKFRGLRYSLPMPAIIEHPRSRTTPHRPTARRLVADTLVSLPDVDWKLYMELDACGVDSGSRLTYLNGRLDIMTLSNDHEQIKNTLHDLIVFHLNTEDLDYTSQGSATRRIPGTHGKEPDDSFYFGTKPKPLPDMVVEVALTSGGIDKLEFYTAFKIPEVWIWQDNALRVFAFDGEAYRTVRKSRLLPKFNITLAGELARWPSTSQAVKEYRKRTAR